MVVFFEPNGSRLFGLAWVWMGPDRAERKHEDDRERVMTMCSQPSWIINPIVEDRWAPQKEQKHPTFSC